MISVVIPLYNHEAYIVDALRGLLAQTRPPDRIIVIDDGSTDRSAAAVRSVKDSRILLLTQPNLGAHATLNRAIALAAEDAEYIGILNSDDLYEPTRIQACCDCLDAHPSASVVTTRLRLIDQSSALIPATDPRARWLQSVWQSRSTSLPAWLGIANFTKTTSNLFARAAYLKAHPFRPYRYIHDYYFAITAALDDQLVVLDQELLRYRVHTTNTIKSGPAENLPREVLRMNLDLLAAQAPALAESPPRRTRLAEYFRTLSQNYADFRLEPFLHLIASQVATLSDHNIEALINSLAPAQFPELLAGKSTVLRENIAQFTCEQTLQTLATSRWLALGRLFGAGPRVIGDAPTAESRLKLLRKACSLSSWYRLGQKLGFLYPD